jgi:hypothetical protein
MGREKEKEGKETGWEGEGSREEDGNKKVGRGEVGGARSEERKGRGGGEGKIWTPHFLDQSYVPGPNQPTLNVRWL